MTLEHTLSEEDAGDIVDNVLKIRHQFDTVSPGKKLYEFYNYLEANYNIDRKDFKRAVRTLRAYHADEDSQHTPIGTSLSMVYDRFPNLEPVENNGSMMDEIGGW